MLDECFPLEGIVDKPNDLLSRSPQLRAWINKPCIYLEVWKLVGLPYAAPSDID